MEVRTEQIAIERMAKGWTRVELAQAAKVSTATITRLEQGKHLRPSTLYRVCVALGISVKALLGASALPDGSGTNKPRGVEQIAIERMAKGWTQVELAQAAKVDKETIARLEQGKHLRPSTLYRVCIALGISVKSLFGASATMPDGRGTNKPRGAALK